MHQPSFVVVHGHGRTGPYVDSFVGRGVQSLFSKCPLPRSLATGDTARTSRERAVQHRET